MTFFTINANRWDLWSKINLSESSRWNLIQIQPDFCTSFNNIMKATVCKDNSHKTKNKMTLITHK